MAGLVRALFLSSVAAVSFSGVAATAQQVPAATADANAAEDIIVTGIRQSLGAARDIKRESVQFVDAIVADDIGKLPDSNVAESLARISGVQVERGIGEGSEISIRGLRENVILYNGRQIVDATGRGGNGLDQLGGSTYSLLSLVPSELISRLEVTKLAGANDIAGALGGIVDIKARLPLDGRGQQIVANAALTYDRLAAEPGFELFGLLSRSFADDTLGVLVTASYSQRDLAEQGLNTFSGYARFTDNSVSPPRTRFGNADIRTQDIEEQRRRLGLSAAIQWQPTDGLEIIADTFYSRLQSERDRYWLSFNPTSGLSNAKYSENDILLSGRATGPVLTNTEYAAVNADVWSTALRGNFRPNEILSGSAEISYGTSSSDYRQLYFRLQPVVGLTPTVDFDLAAGSFGSYDIRGINLSDPSQLRFTILFDQLFRATTDTLAARTDWTINLGPSFLRSFAVGARFSRLDTKHDPLRADIRPPGGLVANTLGNLVETRGNPDFLPGEFAGLPRDFLIASRENMTGCAAFTAFPFVSQNPQCLNPGATLNSVAGTFRVQEDFFEVYTKLNFESDFGESKLSGNIGVRYVDRNMDSTGNVLAASGTATPTIFGRHDGEWLPSAVARLTFGDDFVVRLGAAKVVAFPNTEDLNNGVTLNNNAVFVNGVQTQVGTGTGGAPNLDPFRANQLDASLEYYFANEALASVGVFYKDVSSFIVQRQSAESYSGVNFLINRKVNGEGAKVKGVEVLLQLPFTFLPGALDGFGVVGTYAYIDSETPIRDVSNRVLPFPGLSRNNVNLIGYYEKDWFSARLAYNWRDAYLIGLSAAATGIFNDSYSDLSATMRFAFNERISLNLEANNLLNSKQRTYDGVSEALRTNVLYGQIYKATVSFRF